MLSNLILIVLVILTWPVLTILVGIPLLGLFLRFKRFERLRSSDTPSELLVAVALIPIFLPALLWEGVRSVSFERTWSLGGYLFGHDVRRRAYEPTIEELREDRLVAFRKYRTPLSRSWVRFCLCFRTALVFLACVRISFLRPLQKLIPPRLLHWLFFS